MTTGLTRLIIRNQSFLQRVLVQHARSLCFHTGNHNTNFIITHRESIWNRNFQAKQCMGANSSRRELSTSFSKETAIQNILLEENKCRTLELIPKMRSIVTNTKATVGAAVLVPLCTVNGVPSVLFTLRSSRLKNYQGEVSFPGGKQDRTDRDIIHTALRETEEELGIPPSTVDVWGPLKPMPQRVAASTVVAVLGNVGEVDLTKLKLSPREVSAVFPLSFSHLLDPVHQRYTTVKQRHDINFTYTMPVWLGGPHRIWGLTAMMLDQVLVAMATDWYKSVLRSSARR